MAKASQVLIMPDDPDVPGRRPAGGPPAESAAEERRRIETRERRLREERRARIRRALVGGLVVAGGAATVAATGGLALTSVPVIAGITAAGLAGYAAIREIDRRRDRKRAEAAAQAAAAGLAGSVGQAPGAPQTNARGLAKSQGKTPEQLLAEQKRQRLEAVANAARVVVGESKGSGFDQFIGQHSPEASRAFAQLDSSLRDASGGKPGVIRQAPLKDLEAVAKNAETFVHSIVEGGLSSRAREVGKMDQRTSTLVDSMSVRLRAAGLNAPDSREKVDQPRTISKEDQVKVQSKPNPMAALLMVTQPKQQKSQALSSTLRKSGGVLFPRGNAQAGKHAASSKRLASGAGIFTMSRLWPEA